MVPKVTSQQGLSLTFHVKWVQINIKQTTRFHSMQKPKRSFSISVESPLKLVNFEFIIQNPPRDVNDYLRSNSTMTSMLLCLQTISLEKMSDSVIWNIAHPKLTLFPVYFWYYDVSKLQVIILLTHLRNNECEASKSC